MFLQQLSWGFQIYHLFRKIFKFCDFMDNNTFRENHKSVYKIAKYKYFGKVIIYSKSPDHLLHLKVCNFLGQKMAEILATSRKLPIKS